MKKIALISIGLLLLAATAFGFASAQTETTYYCYSDGGWRVCTDSESILAKEAMEKETPVPLSHDDWSALISSREPFWNYNTFRPNEEDTAIPTPTPTVSPAPTQTPSRDRFWEPGVATGRTERNPSLSSRIRNLFK
jgi:Phr family secreted Rap phosphatase inhibitor